MPIERYTTVVMAILGGITMIFLSLKGPLFLGEISFRTHPLIVNQLLGQDIINILPMSLLMICGGILLLYKKEIGKYLLICTPLYLFYYAMCYAMGWEWMAADYSGNSEQYFFHYLFVLISGVVILLYCLETFPKHRKANFKPLYLGIYSFLMIAFLAVFSAMWAKQVLEVQSTGTTQGYEIAPMAFWMVRTIDLGFCVPLGLISVYLLHKRANQAFAIQFLFYGFFVTQILAVNAMGVIMYLNHDPNISLPELLFFIAMALLLLGGFAFVINGYKAEKKKIPGKS
jgi:hypothetical protein